MPKPRQLCRVVEAAARLQMPVRLPFLRGVPPAWSAARCTRAQIRSYNVVSARDQRNVTASAAPAASASSGAVDLPTDVSDRLKTLPADILNLLYVMDADGKQNSALPSATSAVPPSSSLTDMAKYYFERGGKLVRPTVTLLMSSVCNGRTKAETMPSTMEHNLKNQYRIAMVAEMIHTASLIHDDVIDEAGTRRGVPTVNVKWGNKRAVLGGDRILARATQLLCLTENPDVISTMASIVDNLVEGEFMQLEVNPQADALSRFQHYMRKTYFKTASLFANSCLSVAILAGVDKTTRSHAYEFGRNFGLAFQLMDDMLDYVANSAELGKPSVADLRQGLATAPALFAAQELPDLTPLINRRFVEPGDVQQAYEMVVGSNALQQTRQLIQRHCDMAVAAASELGECAAVGALTKLAASQVHRHQ